MAERATWGDFVRWVADDDAIEWTTSYHLRNVMDLVSTEQQARIAIMATGWSAIHLDESKARWLASLRERGVEEAPEEMQ